MKRLAFIFLLFCYSLLIYAQGKVEDYKRAAEIKQWSGKVYEVPEQILWSEDGSILFYGIRKRNGDVDFFVVNVVTKQKVKIALRAIESQLSTFMKEEVSINLQNSKWEVLNFNEFELTYKDRVYRWNNENLALREYEVKNVEAEKGGRYWGSRADDSKGEAVLSPNNKYRAFLKNNNIYVNEVDNAASEKQLTFDGSPGEYYAAFMEWSNDSKKLAVMKVRKAEVRQLTLLESSPKDQLQPRLIHRDYVKPGDALPQYYPAIIHVESGVVHPVNKELVDNQFALTRIAWNANSDAITFEFNKRGHQVYSIMELHAESGQTRAIVQEESSTFIHYSGKRFRKDLNDNKSIVWASERDGWNHLYLINKDNGEVKQQITKGDWPVRSVVHVDEDAKMILFTASGMKPDEDPYLIRYYRIGFDGQGLKELTPEPANHRGYFSKDYRYFVDVYSTVNAPPRAVLRDGLTGQVRMELEHGNIEELIAEGWRAPEVFSAKGRDGETDIWGIIIRPRNFDERKVYPVVEYIYAGPHDSFVPKSFYANPSGMYELAELGFIVVQIDGMGTSNRSKAFHDVAWKNLKDAGFPDRIAWIKKAAEIYNYMDVSRVGIYGTSAGGQSSTGALLFHPEFYKVAVSSCGCHDNRMDKIWWNEQWMGWPIGPQYAACSNVENAGNLEGKLLLIVGELDDNVDPASTYQLVDALIKNNKDHEMIMVPGMGHSSGGDFGEKKRRDFFVKHLLKVEPPAWGTY